MTDSTTGDNGSRAQTQHDNLSHVSRDDFQEILSGLKDVQEAYDLLELLIDPHVPERGYQMELDPRQLGAMLRILNDSFNIRWSTLDKLTKLNYRQ